jgi:hypothetical protein
MVDVESEAASQHRFQIFRDLGAMQAKEISCKKLPKNLTM